MKRINIFEKLIPKNRPLCIVCRERVPGEYAHVFADNLCICEECYDRIDKFESPAAFEGRKNLKFHIAAFPYTGVLRDAFVRYKFGGERAYGRIFALLLTDCIESFWTPGDFDLIVPVPLSAERICERGYNQSALIAEYTAERLGAEYRDDLLFRTRNTERQSGLNTASRFRNVRGAFMADKTKAAGKSVLLVDDVYTIGATMSECADALFSAGAVKAAGLTLFKSVAPEMKNKKEYAFKEDKD